MNLTRAKNHERLLKDEMSKLWFQLGSNFGTHQKTVPVMVHIRQSNFDRQVKSKEIGLVTVIANQIAALRKSAIQRPTSKHHFEKLLKIDSIILSTHY